VCEIATKREADQRRSSGRSGPWRIGTKGTRFRKSVEWNVARLFPWLTRLQRKDPVVAASGCLCEIDPATSTEEKGGRRDCFGE
jgi:hypothetical protein